MVKYFISVLFLGMILSVPTVAQLTKVETIPPHPDVVSIKVPDGFHFEHSQGVFQKFLHEYVPEGETKENWSQILSLAALGVKIPKNNLLDYANVFFEGFNNTCEDLKVTLVGQNETSSYVSADFKVVCAATEAAQRAMPYVKAVEIGYYRILISNSTTYEFHSAWHGTKEEAESVFYEDEDAFWQNAVDRLNDVSICDVSVSKECSFDRDLYEQDIQQTKGDELRCRKNDDVACYPSAMITLTPHDKSKVDPAQQRGLVILQMDRDDISKMNIAGFIFQKVKESFDQGMPAVLVIIKPHSDPNYIVSSNERAKAAAFSTLLGEIGSQQKLIDAYSLSFMNFQ